MRVGCETRVGVLKILTWYGHLRDTLVGNISTTFSEVGEGPENLTPILPAKVSRNLTDFLFYTFKFKLKLEFKLQSPTHVCIRRQEYE